MRGLSQSLNYKGEEVEQISGSIRICESYEGFGNTHSYHFRVTGCYRPVY